MRAGRTLSGRLVCHIVDGLRILLANEPRAYRETIAAALQVLRPEAQVRTIEPQMLGRELESFAPQFVVCSDLTPATENGVLTWVELYPEHESLSTVSIGGERSVIEKIELSDLLSIVDRTEALLRAR